MNEDREARYQPPQQQEDLPLKRQAKKKTSKTKKTPSSSPPAPPKATVEDGPEDEDEERDNEPVQRPESPPPAKWTKKPSRNTSTPELSTPEASPLPTPPSPAPSSAAGVLGTSKKTYGCGTVTGKPANKECKSLRNCNVINPLIRPEPAYQTAEWKTQFAAFKKYCRQHLGFAKMAAVKHKDPVAESIHLKNREREWARKMDLEEKSREYVSFSS